jgi:integrase
MASFRPHGNGIQAEVFKRGVRRAKTFPTKGAARAWAHRIEAEIEAGDRGDIPNLTFGAALERYGREVSGRKKGARWESIRLQALGRDRIAQVKLRQFGPPHVSDWRQRRLQTVSEASVRREWNLLSHVCTYAVREWRWLKTNPFRGMSRPPDARPRDRIATEDELDRLREIASPAMRRAITMAVETGMRASELSAATVKGRVAYLVDTKNGSRREVPLSAAAVAAWQGGLGISAWSMSGMFAKLCRRLDPPIKGLKFHDLRRTATVRLAPKLHPLELAKVLGHKDMRVTLNTYYRIDPEEVAKKL